MKGYELIKEITERKIKNNTKIKVKIGDTYKATLKYENLMLKWKSGDFDTSILCSAEANFEVIEENKEIEELKELNKISYNEFKYTDTKHRFDLTNIEYDKINELVREVNKINRQLEEQETEDIDTVERELNKMFKEREEK